MMRITRGSLAALGCMAIVAGSAWGPASAMDLNGFLRPEGRGDVSLSFTSESYDEFWVGDTKVSDPGVGKVKTRSISLWAAYGVTPRFSVVGSVPYVKADSDGLGGFQDEHLQDISLMGLYQLGELGRSARHRFVGGLGLRTIASNYEANQPVDTGDGTADALARVVYQIEAGRFYASQQVGYDRRGGDAPDAFPLYTELGMTWGRITYTGFYSRLDAKEGTDIMDPGFTFPSNDDEYERAGAKLYGRITDYFGVSGMYFTTLDGENSGDSTGFSVGINYSFERAAR
jgi:hypothetical protein